VDLCAEEQSWLDWALGGVSAYKFGSFPGFCLPFGALLRGTVKRCSGEAGWTLGENRAAIVRGSAFSRARAGEDLRWREGRTVVNWVLPNAFFEEELGSRR